MNKDQNIELEIKFYLDPRINAPKMVKIPFTVNNIIDFLKKFINKIITEKENNAINLEQTINISNNIGHKKFIKQLVFEKGVQNKNLMNYYVKQDIVKPFFTTTLPHDIMIKVTTATEIKDDGLTFNIKSNKIGVRMKLRLSILLDLEKYPFLKGWRIDITLVKQFQGLDVNIIKKYKNIMFPNNLTVNNFIENAPWNSIDFIEVELEYVGLEDIEIINKSKLEVADQFLSLFLGNLQENFNFKNYLIGIAKYIKHPKQLKYLLRQQSISIKNIGNAAIELNRNQFIQNLLPEIENYYIMDKVDGIRCFGIYKPEKKKDNLFILTDKLEVFTTETPIHKIGKCIVDGEYYKNNLYIFDVIMFDNKNITDQPFNIRLTYFDKIKDIIGKKVKLKSFIKLTKEQYNKQILKLHNTKNKPYETDGIIFTSSDDIYLNTKNYKWKPVEHMSIDFLVKKCPKMLLGIEPYINKPNQILYLLFSGIRNNVFRNMNIKLIKYYKKIFPVTNRIYFPMQFSPGDKPYAYLFYSDKDNLDDKICELIYKIKKEEWKLLRIRNDRNPDVINGNDLGNMYFTAENIWYNYQTPLTIQDITNKNLKLDTYFQVNKSDIHRPAISFNSFVKGQLIQSGSNSDWCIDLGAGKGQDIFRYPTAGIKHLLALEIDKIALRELIKRKCHLQMGKTKHKFQQINPISIYVQIMDLNNPWKQNLQIIKKKRIPIPKEGVDLIICNFVFHYLVFTKKNITNIINFISSLLKKNGKFIFTCFNGLNVFNTLQKHNGKYDVYEGEVLKYSIHQDYQSKKFENCGQKIKVLLPFSKGEYYTEVLVNNKYIETQFNKKNMILQQSQSFSTYLDQFQKQNFKLYNKLTTNDKEYISHYYYSCYTKK